MLEPRQPGCLLDLSTTYAYLRDYANYDRTLAATMGLSPPGSSPDLPLLRALGAVEGRADLGPLRIALDELRDDEEPSGFLRNSY